MKCDTMLRDVGTTVNFVCDRWGRGVRKCLNLRDPIEGGQKSPTDGTTLKNSSTYLGIVRRD